jgi:hypothetical protein
VSKSINNAKKRQYLMEELTLKAKMQYQISHTTHSTTKSSENIEGKKIETSGSSNAPVSKNSQAKGKSDTKKNNNGRH